MASTHPRTNRLASPRFLSFLTAQFLGAVNDNAFRFTLTLFILAAVTGEAKQLRYVNLATFLFPVPFLLFYPVAGYLADRFSKSRIAIVTKTPELLAMSLAIVALSSGRLPMLFVVLFLMATQSAFFSPVKYGLLPESLEPRLLSMANGVLQMTTNMAILLGSFCGMFLFGRFESNPAVIGWIFLAIAVAGTLATLYLPRTPSGSPDTPFTWNPIGSSLRDWREVRKSPVLMHTMLGIGYFGFLGSMFLTIIPVYGRNVLNLTGQAPGLLLMVLSIGIAGGSIIAGKLSRGRVEIGLVPLGSLGLTLFSLDLALFGNGDWLLPLGLPLRATADLVLLGLSAGLYIVPLNALLQQRAPEGMKGRLIAFSNVMTFGAVILAAVWVIVFNDFLRLPISRILLAVAATTLAATFYIVMLVPDFFVRLILWLLTTTVYRIQAQGERRIPREGALIVANHVSLADALLIGSATDRMVRFLLFRPYYEIRWLSWFFKRMHAIPVAAGDSPAQTEASLEKAREQIRQGHIVCIFAEGAITRTGNMLRFKRGFEQIAAATDAPIVPVFLDGVWGSLFSWERGKLLYKRPRRVRDPVRVIFGDPMPSTSTAHEVRRRIEQLSVTAFRLRKAKQRPLEVAFLHTAKRFRRRPFATDSSGTRVTFGQALVRSAALARAMFGENSPRGEHVGLLLPTGVPGALANLATLCAGKVPVNLDPGAPDDVLRFQIADAGIKQLITDPDGLARFDSLRESEGLRVVDIGAIERGLSRGGLTRLGLLCRLVPARFLERKLLRGDLHDVDRTAAIVYSSPPQLEGGQRGVILSHHNLLSNMESLKQVFRVSRDDCILGVLPFSSPFGLMGTLLLPAVVGVHVVYHDDPLDATTVDRLSRRHRVSLLPLAPAHLQAYVDNVSPHAFPDLRHAVVAGGNLTPELRDRFRERYAVEPLEGFGCAECSPLVSLNVPTVVLGRHRQVGHRRGTSGQPLPGMAVKIVDPQSGESLPPNGTGMLLVQGPNVMQGYLNDPALTAEVLRDGWYRTGYAATQDADGFLTLLGSAAE